MKQGKSLQELATEIQAQQDAKKDYIVPMSKLQMNPNGTIRVQGINDGLDLTGYAHGQVASYTGIPKKYYDRLLGDEAGQFLLCDNVNHWLEEKEDDKRLIRTFEGINEYVPTYCRAFLSNRYNMLDNYDLMQAVLPLLSENNIKIASSEVTDKKLYIKAVFPNIEGEVIPGDVVQSGIVISNSEVGAGTVQIQPLIYRLVCDNGLIVPDSSIRKMHVGRQQGLGSGVQELLSDETKMQNDKAFWMTVRDVVSASMNDVFFKTYIDKLRESTGTFINKSPDLAVEQVVKLYSLGEDDNVNILNHLIQGGDLTKWGMVNAVTRTANDNKDYEKATELETIGGNIIELSKRDWSKIANVA